jgi:hypothetical protein
LDRKGHPYNDKRREGRKGGREEGRKGEWVGERGR